MIQRIESRPGSRRPPATHTSCRPRGGRTIYHLGPGGLRREGTARGQRMTSPRRRSQVFANLETALRAAGATFNDVVKTNYYMLDASQVQRRAR